MLLIKYLLLFLKNGFNTLNFKQNMLNRTKSQHLFKNFFSISLNSINQFNDKS